MTSFFFFFFVFGVLSTFLLSATLWFCTLSLLSLISTAIGVWVLGWLGSQIIMVRGFWMVSRLESGFWVRAGTGFRVGAAVGGGSRVVRVGFRVPGGFNEGSVGGWFQLKQM